MRIVVLDYPECEATAPWHELEALGTVERFSQTTLPELLERARSADVLITHSFPFRREILDYLTHPRIILVPAQRMDELVELPIARQLGIMVTAFSTDDPPCGWIRSAAERVRGSLP